MFKFNKCLVEIKTFHVQHLIFDEWSAFTSDWKLIRGIRLRKKRCRRRRKTTTTTKEKENSVLRLNQFNLNLIMIDTKSS